MKLQRNLVLAAAAVAILSATVALAGSPKVFGEGVSEGDPVKISKIMEDPESWVGKTVKIEGPVVFVCKHRGKSIDLASDEEFQQLKVMMDPGTFPMELMGKKAVAEGELKVRQLSMEETKSYLEHESKAHGGAHDPEEVDGPLRIYFIEGKGVEVR
jgi:hypothetical protein